MLCIFHLISGMLLLADDGHRVGKDCDEAPKVLAKASRAVVFKCLKKDIKGFEWLQRDETNRANHDGKARQGDDETRGDSPIDMAIAEKEARLFVYMVRLRKTLSYSANRARTIRSKTQSWKTKMMSMTAKATSIAFDLLVQTVSWVLIARVSRLTVMSRFLRVAMRFDINLDSVCCWETDKKHFFHPTFTFCFAFFLQ